MGMTLWIHTLEGRNMGKHSRDHSNMYRIYEELDKICDELDVSELSSFFDTTDMELNMSDEQEPDREPAPETGYAYGIDDMKWFDAAAGLQTLTALHSHVSRNAIPRFDKEKNNLLLAELSDCIEKLEGPAASGGKFHLAVIM